MGFQQERGGLPGGGVGEACPWPAGEPGPGIIPDSLVYVILVFALDTFPPSHSLSASLPSWFLPHLLLLRLFTPSVCCLHNLSPLRYDQENPGGWVGGVQQEVPAPYSCPYFVTQNSPVPTNTQGYWTTPLPSSRKLHDLSIGRGP